MKPILVIRHAEPTDCSWNVGTHWVDCALTERGRRQADCLAERLAKDLSGVPCRIISSDLRRARQTAEPTAQALGLEIVTTPELREYHNGYNDRSEEEIRRFVEEETQPTRDLRAHPQAETAQEFYGRISGCMERLLNDGDERQTLVFAHFGAISSILAWWLQLERDEKFNTRISFDVTLASLQVLKMRFGKRSLERVNDTSHLYAAGLAPKIPTEPC